MSSAGEFPTKLMDGLPVCFLGSSVTFEGRLFPPGKALLPRLPQIVLSFFSYFFVSSLPLRPNSSVTNLNHNFSLICSRSVRSICHGSVVFLKSMFSPRVSPFGSTPRLNCPLSIPTWTAHPSCRPSKSQAEFRFSLICLSSVAIVSAPQMHYPDPSLLSPIYCVPQRHTHRLPSAARCFSRGSSFPSRIIRTAF